MYRCNSCGELLSDDEVTVADTSFAVPYGEGYVLCPEQEAHCSCCGSEDVDYLW